MDVAIPMVATQNGTHKSTEIVTVSRENRCSQFCDCCIPFLYAVAIILFYGTIATAVVVAILVEDKSVLSVIVFPASAFIAVRAIVLANEVKPDSFYRRLRNAVRVADARELATRWRTATKWKRMRATLRTDRVEITMAVDGSGVSYGPPQESRTEVAFADVEVSRNHVLLDDSDQIGDLVDFRGGLLLVEWTLETAESWGQLLSDVRSPNPRRFVRSCDSCGDVSYRTITELRLPFGDLRGNNSFVIVGAHPPCWTNPCVLTLLRIVGLDSCVIAHALGSMSTLRLTVRKSRRVEKRAEPQAGQAERKTAEHKAVEDMTRLQGTTATIASAEGEEVGSQATASIACDEGEAAGSQSTATIACDEGEEVSKSQDTAK